MSLIWYVVVILCLNFASSTSLKRLIKNCYASSGNCSMYSANSAEKNSGKGVTKCNSYKRKLTVEAISRNPCVLTEIASYFEAKNVRVIVSKHRHGLENTLKSCKGIFGRSMTKSVVYIEGDENDYSNLKKSALHFLQRDIRCYVVICSDMCSSLILNIAESLGFGESHYIWIIIVDILEMYEIKYPKTLLTLTKTRNIYQKLCNLECFHEIPVGHTSYVKKVSKHACHTMVLRKPYEELSLKMVTSQLTNFPAINFPELAEKTILRVVMITSLAIKARPDLLDHHEMLCQSGLLCWTYPLRNGSLSKSREPTCCLGYPIDILLHLKEDMHIDFYLYEVADQRWGGK